MFSNIRSCYRRCLSPNQDLYIEIQNDCPFHIHVYLCYKVDEERYTNLSPIFGPGQSHRMYFPFGALNVIFRPFDCDKTPERILCSKFISSYISSAYKVTGPGRGHIKCEKIYG